MHSRWVLLKQLLLNGLAKEFLQSESKQALMLIIDLDLPICFIFNQFILGCVDEDYVIFSTRISSYLHSLCKWHHFKCVYSSAYIFMGDFDIRGMVILITIPCF